MEPTKQPVKAGTAVDQHCVQLFAFWHCKVFMLFFAEKNLAVPDNKQLHTRLATMFPKENAQHKVPQAWAIQHKQTRQPEFFDGLCEANLLPNRLTHFIQQEILAIHAQRWVSYAVSWALMQSKLHDLAPDMK